MGGATKSVDLNDLLNSLLPWTWRSELRYHIRRLRPRELRREIRWGIQRWRRGYSDLDVWSFNHYLAQIIPPAMRQLSSELHGVPVHLMEEFRSPEVAEAEWRRILEAVAVGFEAWSTIDEEFPERDRLAELQDKFDTGAGLLIKHFGSFWD
jgi:hypothetical protein